MIEYFDWQARFPRHQVVNLGIAGETTHDLRVRLPTVVRQQPPPDLILLMTGTNDLVMEDYGLLNVYREILQTLRASLPQTGLLATSLLPFGVPWVAPATIMRINKELAGLCQITGASFLHIYPLFTNEQNRPRTELFLADAVHLSDKGYQIWADAMEKQLSQTAGRPF